MTLQNSPDRTATGQTTTGTAVPKMTRSLPKDHADHWTKRLKKRHYVDRNGNKVEVPEYQVRLFSAGHEGWFNLGTGNRAAAAAKARDIAVHLKAHGWDATLAAFKPKPLPKDTLTIEDFSEVYRDAVRDVDYPPSHQTLERYLTSLRMFATRAGVCCIRDLTPDKVEAFKTTYLAQGRKEGRDSGSVRISCNAILRNVAALFSEQMREAYKARALFLENPFKGKRLRRIELKAYSPMHREMLDTIWREAAKLRDGDPSIPERKPIKTGGVKAKKRPEDRAKRWREPDFHSPQPGPYVLLLLELGLGLRRNEADKAQWDWFSTDGNGRHFITVQGTPFFIPKSRQKRVIPVEKLLYETIQATRDRVSPFIVPGPLPRRYAPGGEPKNLAYRCEADHRKLAFWLRKHGVVDEKPCHLLRKEFGSYVATAFGLFHAQRMLGYSSPDVTDAFYAGLTNMPELNHAKLTPPATTQAGHSLAKPSEQEAQA